LLIFFITQGGGGAGTADPLAVSQDQKSSAVAAKSAVDDSRGCAGVLSAEAFEALPETTRGRAKFEAVAAAYAVIERLFVEKNFRLVKGAPPEGVSLKDLHAGGATVHGRSGECALQSLRSLGLVTLSKTGGVRLTKPTTKAQRAKARENAVRLAGGAGLR